MPKVPVPRLRDVEWFPEHGHPAPYVASVVGLPVLALLALANPTGLPQWRWIVVLTVPWFQPAGMAMDVAASYGRSVNGWSALRAQVWLQAGGALPAAVRALRRRDRPPT